MNDFVLKYDKHFEKRGSLYTVYNKNDFPMQFVQDKISKSYRGVIRGFHGDDKTWKLISCLYGKIKLVTYNINSGAKESYILDGDDTDSASILISPRTLNAHQCLSDECIFYYKWSEFYTSPEDQWSVNYNDPDISPNWVKLDNCIVSDRDAKAQSLKELKRKIIC